MLRTTTHTMTKAANWNGAEIARILRMFLVTALALLLTFASGETAMGGESHWVEICGENGPRLIDVADAETPQKPNCLHCADCMLSSASVPATTAENFVLTSAIFHASSRIPTHNVSALAFSDSEHRCRAPPQHAHRSETYV